jgi:cytochrome c-type biogenesis protein CcmH/NrfG
MAIHAGPRVLVIATFASLTVGFLLGYWLAPRAEEPVAPAAGAAPHAVGPQEYVQLGMQSLEAGDYATAESHFRRAIEMDPESAEAHTDLAVSLMYQERWQDAHGELEVAGQLGPDTAEVYFLQGVVYRDGMSDIARARKAWERFLAMVPANSPQAATVETWLEGLGTDGGGAAQ